MVGKRPNVYYCNTGPGVWMSSVVVVIAEDAPSALELVKDELLTVWNKTEIDRLSLDDIKEIDSDYSCAHLLFNGDY